MHSFAISWTDVELYPFWANSFKAVSIISFSFSFNGSTLSEPGGLRRIWPYSHTFCYKINLIVTCFFIMYYLYYKLRWPNGQSSSERVNLEWENWTKWSAACETEESKWRKSNIRSRLCQRKNGFINANSRSKQITEILTAILSHKKIDCKNIYSLFWHCYAVCYTRFVIFNWDRRLMKS